MTNPLRLSVEHYVAATASAGPTPGGGSAAAVAGALAAGLVEKIVYLVRLRSLQPARRRAAQLRRRLLAAADNDQQAYLALIRIRRHRVGARARQQAWLRAATVPTDIVMMCAEVEQLARRVVTHADHWLGPDVRCAVALAQAGARGARALAQMNLEHLPDIPAARRLRVELTRHRIR